MIKRIRTEEGQALVEYAIILAIIALAAVASLNQLNGAISGVFTNIQTILSTV